MDEYDIRDVEDQLDALETECEALRDQRDRFATALVYMEWGMYVHAMSQMEKHAGDFDVLRDIKARLDDE